MKIDNDKIDNHRSARWRSLATLLRKQWLRALIIVALGFAVHVPALQGQLVWDDDYLARENPFMKSPLLAVEAFRHYLFLDSYSAHYRPVQNLSLMFDYFFWNTNTFGFHLTNVLLHAAAGVLLYLLLSRIFDSLGQISRKIDNSIFAFFVAAIWVVHPVHSAAIDYISGRADSLAFVFACAAWLLYFKARSATSRIVRALVYCSAAVSALTALCSRESALMWVALFCLHLFAFDKTLTRRAKIFAAIGCALIVAAYAGLRDLPQQRPSKGPSMDWTPPVRAMLLLRALGDYTRLLVFPSNLHMERTIFNGPAFQSEQGREAALTLEYLSILGVTSLAAFVAASFWRGRAQRMRIVGGAWFIIAFLPISNVVDLNATVAEHWLYLPSVGAFIFLLGCAAEFRIKAAQLSALAAALVIALGVRSAYRSSDWVDAETFYTRTAEAGGTSGRVSVNLGQIYIAHGEYAKAEKLFRNVLKFQPDYTIARNNLATALSHLGRDEEAMKVLAEATAGAHESRRDYPRTWIAAVNYAGVLAQEDMAGAIEVLGKARADYPENWELIAGESELYRRTNDFSCGIELVRPFAEKNWWHYASWLALGRLHAENGDVDLAESALRHASQLDVHASEPLNVLALIQIRQNHLDDAFRSQSRAVARQPEQPRQYVLLSNILDKMGRAEEARAALAKVSQLRALAVTSPTHSP